MSFPALEQAVREAGLQPLPPDALARFRTYIDLLLKWNSRLNLTAIRKPEAILRRHFVECIECAQELPVSGAGRTLLDFGSGAGLPGIPIAICNPEVRVTMAESQRKKAAFLREAVRALGIDAHVFDGRVESMEPGRRFDVVTLRAIDKMTEACRIALGRASPGGWMMVFATEASRPGVKLALPSIAWQRELPIIGMRQGRILVGQRTA